MVGADGEAEAISGNREELEAKRTQMQEQTAIQTGQRGELVKVIEVRSSCVSARACTCMSACVFFVLPLHRSLDLSVRPMHNPSPTPFSLNLTMDYLQETNKELTGTSLSTVEDDFKQKSVEFEAIKQLQADLQTYYSALDK